MKKGIMLALALSVGGALPASAQSSEETAMCDIYGSAGGAVLGVMLPVTIAELIAMSRGANPELLGEITKAMLNTFDDATVGILSAGGTSEEDLSLLGEAAGQQVMMLAMAGAVSTPAEARANLSSACERVGSAAIISQMKAAKSALQSVQ